MDYALVTGSTSGIGLAIARKLLQDDLFVYLNYAHNEENAEKALKEANHISAHCALIRANLSEYSGAETLVKRVVESDIKLKYLVLNCGITDRTPFQKITQDSWNEVMDTNVNIPFFILQGLFDSLADNGSVICMGSLMATIPHSVSISYGVSKAAMSALCRNMVKVLAPRGIRINTVEPGFVNTPWQNEKPDSLKDRIASKIALRRFAEAEEIAEICFSVLKNGYINGAVIPADGGYCME